MAPRTDRGPHASSAAVPWLKKLADRGDVHAAWKLSLIAPNDDTLTRALIRILQVQRKPSAAEDELFWLRDDAGLNQQIVPLLVEVLRDASVDEVERKNRCQATRLSTSRMPCQRCH